MKVWIQIRVIQPFLNLLKTGLSPQKLAQSVAFGLVMAVVPALGCSTLLCLVAAFRFRLNMLAIQTVNYLAYPLQFLLIIPFFRAGEWLFKEPQMQISPSRLVLMIKNTPMQAIHDLWTVSWHALVVWLVLAPLGIALITWALTPVFERAAVRSTQAIG